MARAVNRFTTKSNRILKDKPNTVANLMIDGWKFLLLRFNNAFSAFSFVSAYNETGFNLEFSVRISLSDAP